MVKDKLDESSISNVVVLSLADSLKGGNPYEEIDDKFHPGLFDSKVSKIREESSKTVMSSKDF
ncbi:MAG: hypothetical protein L6V78_04455 [Clostridium sp.]|nr:MAG: hypothetical protein L6V78_04455 [Clostridium sp.]